MAIDIKKASTGSPSTAKYWGVAAAIAVAFFLSYGYANAAKSGTPAYAGNNGQAQSASAGAAGGAAGGGCGGGCCGGGSSTPIPGTAKVEGGVQKITIDTTSGSYSPNEVTLKAGVPTEITFTPSSGCLQGVIFPDAGIQQDLSQGATIKLPAMKAGEYQWSCGMQMAFGKLIVK